MLEAIAADRRPDDPVIERLRRPACAGSSGADGVKSQLPVSAHTFRRCVTNTGGATPVIQLYAGVGTDDVLIVDDVCSTTVFRHAGPDVLTTDRSLTDGLPRVVG